VSEVQPLPHAREPAEPAVSASAVAAEANRRLAQLGWPVVVEPDPSGPSSLRIRRVLFAPRVAPTEPTSVTLPIPSGDPDEAVSRLIAEVRRRGWDQGAQATVRLARSAIWCEPI